MNMSIKEKMKLIGSLAVVFIVMPMWFTLLYQILNKVDADSFTWGVYWAYVPISILATTIMKLNED
jgi:hypothetical protein